MKRRTFIINGQTDAKGIFSIANKGEMLDYFKKLPNGFFIMTCEIVETHPLSVPMLVYYKKKIVPDIQAAFLEKGEIKTLKETDYFLRSYSKITIGEKYNYDTRKWESDLRDIEKLNNYELSFFLQEIKQLAAMEFGVYFEDINTVVFNSQEYLEMNNFLKNG